MGRWLTSDVAVWTTLLAVLSLGLFVPTLGAAQSNQSARAKQLFEEGRTLYQKEDYEEAAQTFQKAYEISERGALLYNIGKSYEEAEELQQAETYYQKYLEEKPDAPNEDEVVQKIIELQETIAARMGSLQIETEESGRSVFVGEEEEARCQTPCSVSLAPGVHQVEIRGEGMVTAEEHVAMGKSESQSLSLALEPQLDPGRLVIETSAGGGRVEIDGEGSHSLPMRKGVELDPGDYRLEIVASNGASWSGTATVEDDETTRLFVPLTETSGGATFNVRRTIALGLGGAAVALLAGSAIVGSHAQDTHSLLSTHQRQRGAVDSGLVDQGKTQMQTANILLGAGVGALASGLGLFTWDLLAGPSSSDSK